MVVRVPSIFILSGNWGYWRMWYGVSCDMFVDLYAHIEFYHAYYLFGFGLAIDVWVDRDFLHIYVVYEPIDNKLSYFAISDPMLDPRSMINHKHDKYPHIIQILCQLFMTSTGYKLYCIL